MAKSLPTPTTGHNQQKNANRTGMFEPHLQSAIPATAIGEVKAMATHDLCGEICPRQASALALCLQRVNQAWEGPHA